jgi:hypothetical protein
MAKSTLFTIGYGRWAPDRRIKGLISELTCAGVNMLVDIRHSPCASQLTDASNYGPRDWHLQLAGHGIESVLNAANVEYRWVVELGNPQKTDPEMEVLRQHLQSSDRRWPVNRGLDLLEQMILEKGRTCCLLCVCKDWRECHRAIIAEAIRELWRHGSLEVIHLPRER